MCCVDNYIPYQITRYTQMHAAGSWLSRKSLPKVTRGRTVGDEFFSVLLTSAHMRTLPRATTDFSSGPAYEISLLHTGQPLKHL